jgi:hypothetical protein
MLFLGKVNAPALEYLFLGMGPRNPFSENKKIKNNKIKNKEYSNQ